MPPKPDHSDPVLQQLPLYRRGSVLRQWRKDGRISSDEKESELAEQDEQKGEEDEVFRSLGCQQRVGVVRGNKDVGLHRCGSFSEVP